MSLVGPRPPIPYEVDHYPRPLVPALRGQAGHHRAVAGQRPVRAHPRADDRARRRVRRASFAASQHLDSGADVAGRAVKPRRFLNFGAPEAHARRRDLDQTSSPHRGPKPRRRWAHALNSGHFGQPPSSRNKPCSSAVRRSARSPNPSLHCPRCPRGLCGPQDPEYLFIVTLSCGLSTGRSPPHVGVKFAIKSLAFRAMRGWTRSPARGRADACPFFPRRRLDDNDFGK